jgi:formylglycine-generating enzyme required for sulfatase activity
MNKMGVLAAHLHSTIPSMNDANPDVQVPPQVERLVMTCLEKDPDLRPQSAHELATLFREAIKGHEEPESKRPGRTRSAWSIMAACALLAGLIFGTPLALKLGKSGRPTDPKTDSENTDIGVTRAKNADVPKKKMLVVTGADDELAGDKFWTSQGYEPLNTERLQTVALGKEVALESFPAHRGDAPAGLRRKSDKRVFYAFAKGVYLPLGYSALDPNSIDGFWPKVIVRSSDKVRFIRINGGKYIRGDFRNHTPILDLKDNPCTPHEVEVSGFYIQETEVTNKEIDAYLKKYPDAKLMSWKEGLSVLINDAKRNEAEVMQYPAVFINRATAQQYAQAVDGRLPTEAEWEYAARSRGQNNIWAWKNMVGKKGSPRAYLGPIVNEPYPVPVKTFQGEDETDQRVFDMTGNVREWCHDVYRSYSDLIADYRSRLAAEGKNPDQPIHDPRVGGEPEADNLDLTYVARGGSFMDKPEAAMVFQRDGVPANAEPSYVGFRVVIQCPAEPSELSE